MVLCWALLSAGGQAAAQGLDPEGRLIVDVRIEGLQAVPEQLVRNAIRTQAGQAYSARVVREDIRRLEQLGRFGPPIESAVQELDTGALVVVFRVHEEPALAGIRFQGNKRFIADRLLTRVVLRAGDPIDRSLIERGARSIERVYEEEGYFAVSVDYDEQALTQRRELIYRIVEGPKVRIAAIRFEGNAVFRDEALRDRIRSQAYAPILLNLTLFDGDLDRSQLDFDVAAVRQFYQDAGYLEADVGRTISLSPNNRDAIVTFQIKEGPRYIVSDIAVRFTRGGQPTDRQLFQPRQIEMLLDVVRGGVYSDQRVENSERSVAVWYGRLGYINTRVSIDRLFNPEAATVDVVVGIDEGTGPTRAGTLTVIGNSRTKIEEVLHRINGVEPGRPIDYTGLELTRALVRESTLFTGGTVTLLGGPDDPVRDILIEVNERNTGSFNFFLGVSSDLGVGGGISLSQRNFDLTDFPESFDEFANGEAFIGDGQRFTLSIAPGNENSNFDLGFQEPYLFNSDYFFRLNLRLSENVREDFDEDRGVATISLGRRLGDVWTGSVSLTYEDITINDIAPEASVDVFNVAGSNTLTRAGFSLTRSTTDSNIQPSRGSRITLGVDQYGVFGGDFDFTRATFAYSQFFTLGEDFLGRKSIFNISVDAGYIFDDAQDVPLFERFYAGGRNFRGFDFRGIGPRGIQNDTMLLGEDPVGGQFRLLMRLEYEVPFYQENIRLAFFTDQGTVQDELGVDQWRVSVGTGLRLIIPFFGQAPIALDLALPLIEEDGDETQFFSFSVDVPFN